MTDRRREQLWRLEQPLTGQQAACVILVARDEVTVHVDMSDAEPYVSAVTDESAARAVAHDIGVMLSRVGWRHSL